LLLNEYFFVVSVYFFESVRKLLDTTSYSFSCVVSFIPRNSTL